MVELFTVCVLHCCTHIFSNDRQWLSIDVQSLKSAQNRCIVHYPKSPCLTRFVKTEPQVYRATCGKDNVK